MKSTLITLVMIFTLNSYAINGTYDCKIDTALVTIEITDSNFNFLDPSNGSIYESKKFSSAWVDESESGSDIVNKYKMVKLDDSILYQYFSKVSDENSDWEDTTLTTISLTKHSDKLLIGTYSTVDFDELGQELEDPFHAAMTCTIK